MSTAISDNFLESGNETECGVITWSHTQPKKQGNKNSSQQQQDGQMKVGGENERRIKFEKVWGRGKAMYVVFIK